MRKTALLFILILLITNGCLRKHIQRRDVVRQMKERTNADWMMIGKQLRAGDSALYCLTEYRGKREKNQEKLDRQCRKWTVTDQRENTLTLELEMVNAPPELSDILRTYVVDRNGFILDAKAHSTKRGEEWKIRIAGKSEECSLDRVVPADRFTADDLEIINRYSYEENGRRYLISDEFGPVEVVPVKTVYRPTERKQMLEYYLTSDLSPFGYLVQITLRKNLKNSEKDSLWVNRLKPENPRTKAPAP
jgi:hypothetical protein